MSGITLGAPQLQLLCDALISQLLLLYHRA